MKCRSFDFNFNIHSMLTVKEVNVPLGTAMVISRLTPARKNEQNAVGSLPNLSDR